MSEPLTVPSYESHAPASDYAIDRFLHPIRRLTRLAGLALIAAMILLPAIQVAFREFLGIPLVGVEELTRFMLICVVFITFPYVIASGANIRLEELLNSLPRRFKRIVHLLIGITGTIVLGIGAFAIAVATANNLSNATPTLGIPYWIFFSASFIGFLLAAVEYALQVWKAAYNLPLFVTFADEAPADDMAALEASLMKQTALDIERSST